ncbi:STY4528 family pathogenicity island replication protein [Sodalis sp. RH20]|uniref:STY4528 family pathogenicity island replication protein n=1 Tax=unclassified Sodalis (in: enterobacteria) TaxID=2636512 RepID=UPI0039B409F4
MAHHHHNMQGHDALFTTPTALMLDTRLTPLERNCWQVLRMLRAADGLSPLASLGQLRRYLTSTPLGQRAGYETAWRVLVVLRLTGWISLVGQHRDPMTDHVLSELYQVHESTLTFHQACALDATLPELLQTSIGHGNNQVDRVAMYIQETLEHAPTAAPSHAEDQGSDDDEPPASRMSPVRGDQNTAQAPTPGDSVSTTAGPQQTDPAQQTTPEQDSTYSKYLNKKERTYRARAHEDVGPVSPPVALPPCLGSAKAEQQNDVRTALHRLPPQYRQDVLDELQARSQSGTVRNVIAYFFGLVRRVLAGEFRLWAGRKAAQPASRPQQAAPCMMARIQRAEICQGPTPKLVSRETALAHIADIRKMLNMPVNAGDLAAQVMQAKGWHTRPA